MKKGKPKTLYLTLIDLPMFDDPYLQSQAHNLQIVDSVLTDMEKDVLREYFAFESTPSSAFNCGYSGCTRFLEHGDRPTLTSASGSSNRVKFEPRASGRHIRRRFVSDGFF
jgi:hypothetical protein